MHVWRSLNIATIELRLPNVRQTQTSEFWNFLWLSVVFVPKTSLMLIRILYSNFGRIYTGNPLKSEILRRSPISKVLWRSLLLNCDDIIFRINSSNRFVILRTASMTCSHLNATLLFLSDCGILQFTLFPKLEQTGTAHSLITHLKSTNELIILFMIIVAQFYLFYISSYYLVFSLYEYSIVLAIFASVLVL